MLLSINLKKYKNLYIFYFFLKYSVLVYSFYYKKLIHIAKKKPIYYFILLKVLTLLNIFNYFLLDIYNNYTILKKNLNIISIYKKFKRFIKVKRKRKFLHLKKKKLMKKKYLYNYNVFLVKKVKLHRHFNYYAKKDSEFNIEDFFDIRGKYSRNINYLWSRFFISAKYVNKLKKKNILKLKGYFRYKKHNNLIKKKYNHKTINFNFNNDYYHKWKFYYSIFNNVYLSNESVLLLDKNKIYITYLNSNTKNVSVKLNNLGININNIEKPYRFFYNKNKGHISWK